MSKIITSQSLDPHPTTLRSTCKGGRKKTFKKILTPPLSSHVFMNISLELGLGLGGDMLIIFTFCPKNVDIF